MKIEWNQNTKMATAIVGAVIFIVFCVWLYGSLGVMQEKEIESYLEDVLAAEQQHKQEVGAYIGNPRTIGFAHGATSAQCHLFLNYDDMPEVLRIRVPDGELPATSKDRFTAIAVCLNKDGNGHDFWRVNEAGDIKKVYSDRR